VIPAATVTNTCSALSFSESAAARPSSPITASTSAGFTATTTNVAFSTASVGEATSTE
jgi:hypothetical protein